MRLERKILLAMALFVLAVGSLSPAIASTSLIDAANAFDQAQLSGDRAALERMVADDLIFIDGSGKRLGKKDFIDGWTTPGDSYEPLILVDRVVIKLGPNVGVVNAETMLKGSSSGKPFSSRFRFADTFRRENGKWQAVHIQVTRMQ